MRMPFLFSSHNALKITSNSVKKLTDGLQGSSYYLGFHWPNSPIYSNILAAGKYKYLYIYIDLIICIDR